MVDVLISAPQQSPNPYLTKNITSPVTGSTSLEAQIQQQLKNDNQAVKSAPATTPTPTPTQVTPPKPAPAPQPVGKQIDHATAQSIYSGKGAYWGNPQTAIRIYEQTRLPSDTPASWWMREIGSTPSGFFATGMSRQAGGGTFATSLSSGQTAGILTGGVLVTRPKEVPVATTYKPPAPTPTVKIDSTLAKTILTPEQRDILGKAASGTIVDIHAAKQSGIITQNQADKLLYLQRGTGEFASQEAFDKAVSDLNLPSPVMGFSPNGLLVGSSQQARNIEAQYYKATGKTFIDKGVAVQDIINKTGKSYDQLIDAGIIQPQPGEYGYHRTTSNPAGLYNPVQTKYTINDLISGRVTLTGLDTNKPPMIIRDSKYGLMIRSDAKISDLPPELRTNIDASNYILYPIAKETQKFTQYASGKIDDLVNLNNQYNPVVHVLNRNPVSGALVTGVEQFGSGAAKGIVSMPEFFAVAGLGAETVARNIVSNPSQVAAATGLGLVLTVGGLEQGLTEHPIETLGMLYGAKKFGDFTDIGISKASKTVKGLVDIRPTLKNIFGTRKTPSTPFRSVEYPGETGFTGQLMSFKEAKLNVPEVKETPTIQSSEAKLMSFKEAKPRVPDVVETLDKTLENIPLMSFRDAKPSIPEIVEPIKSKAVAGKGSIPTEEAPKNTKLMSYEKATVRKPEIEEPQKTSGEASKLMSFREAKPRVPDIVDITQRPPVIGEEYVVNPLEPTGARDVVARNIGSRSNVPPRVAEPLSNIATGGRDILSSASKPRPFYELPRISDVIKVEFEPKVEIIDLTKAEKLKSPVEIVDLTKAEPLKSPIETIDLSKAEPLKSAKIEKPVPKVKAEKTQSIKRDIGSELKDTWAERNLALEKEAKESGSRAVTSKTGQQQILLYKQKVVEKPTEILDLTKLSEEVKVKTKPKTVQKQVVIQRPKVEVLDLTKLSYEKLDINPFVLTAQKTKESVITRITPISEVRPTFEQFSISPTNQAPSFVQTSKEVPKQVSKTTPKTAQSPIQAPVQSPIQSPIQEPIQSPIQSPKQVQFPRPFLDLYYTGEPINSEIPIDLPSLVDDEKRKRPKPRRIKYIQKTIVHPISEIPSDFFNPNPVKQAPRTAYKPFKHSKPTIVKQPTFNFRLGNMRNPLGETEKKTKKSSKKSKKEEEFWKI